MSSISRPHTEKRHSTRSRHGSSPNHSILTANCGVDKLKNRTHSYGTALPDIRERLMRIETKIEGMESNISTKTDLAELKLSTKTDLTELRMSTKTDLAELKVSITEGFNSQTKWFIGTAMVLASVAFAAARLIQ
ncbi:MAG: hypothetical protein JWR17_2150 [Pseudomonas sp.]|uniref:hypothetical protein n=1 Tax=Pseudomonas sp. TaxID=306 RepID=UPI002603A0E5|nr:hypothetical protein [Pseudomonas sp.]MDB6049404.1 hypothetical protein [Pseudomonas sp.]